MQLDSGCNARWIEWFLSLRLFKFKYLVMSQSLNYDNKYLLMKIKRQSLNYDNKYLLMKIKRRFLTTGEWINKICQWYNLIKIPPQIFTQINYN